MFWISITAVIFDVLLPVKRLRETVKAEATQNKQTNLLRTLASLKRPVRFSDVYKPIKGLIQVSKFTIYKSLLQRDWRRLSHRVQFAS